MNINILTLMKYIIINLMNYLKLFGKVLNYHLNIYPKNINYLMLMKSVYWILNLKLKDNIVIKNFVYWFMID